jgi:glycosyltransferase involved in cell wall biosynthesis
MSCAAVSDGRAASTSAPFFSIGLPTRNRSSLLRTAVRTILEQSFGDFELIIHDNASTDDTEAVVQQWRDPRIRYVRRPEWTPVPQLEEMTWRMARGRYAYMIGDDDALLPDALQIAHDLQLRYGPEFVCHAVGWSYYHPDWPDERRRNALHVSRFTGGITLLDSKHELQSFFENGISGGRHPIVTNGFYRTEHVHRLLDTYGNIHLNDHMGDPAIAVFMLHSTRRYLYVDEPLKVAGYFSQSRTAQFQGRLPRDKEYQLWFKNTERIERLLERVPLKIPIWDNFCGATALELKEMLEIPFEFNWELYFIGCWESLEWLGRSGVEVRDHMRHFREVLEAQEPRLRERVRKYLAGDRCRLPGQRRRFMHLPGEWIGPSARQCSAARRIQAHVPNWLYRDWGRCYRRFTGYGREQWVHGARAGFEDIVGAVRYLVAARRQLRSRRFGGRFYWD